jgi:FkbM family methyltransferase
LALSKRVKHTGKVFAFEPCPENRRCLEELIVANQLSSVVIPIELALTDRDGEQNLIIGETPFLNSLESSIDSFPKADTAKIPVRTAKVDTLVLQGKIPPPDFIKLDVEGGEFQVLKGAQRTLETYFPEILIEIHGPQNGERVWDLLEPYRYTWWHVARGGKHRVSAKVEALSLFLKEVRTRHFHLQQTRGAH